MALSVGRIYGLIELRDQFTAKIRQAAGEAERAAKSVQTMQQRFEDAGRKMMGAGATLTAGVTMPIVGIGAMALKSSIDFGASMNRIKAATITTGESTESVTARMSAFRAAAIEWGAKTSFSATEAADAMTELAKAGLETSEVVGALPSTLQLATAGQMGLAEAASLSANTMRTFGLQVSDMAAANDTLAKAANSSTIDVRDLSETLKYVGPVAKVAGVSLETTAAAAAAMGEAGVKGSMAGTALRGVLTTLMTPTEKQAGLMKQLGLETAFVDGKMKPLPEIIGMLEQAIKNGASAGEVGAAAMELFGDRAGPGLLALVNKGSDALVKLEKSLYAPGYAAQVAAAQMEGLPGAIERMKGAVETASVALGDVLAPAATKVADFVGALADILTTYVVPAFSMIPGPIKVVIGLIVALAAAIGPLLLVLGSMSLGWGALLPVLKGGQAILFTLTNTVPMLTARLWLMDTATKVMSSNVIVMGRAWVTANASMLIAAGTAVMIGAAIAGIILALPKAIDGLKNMYNAFKDMDFSNIGKRDTNNFLWKAMGWDDQSQWEKQFGSRQRETKDVNLPTDTINIEGVVAKYKKGAGDIVSALDSIDAEVTKFRTEHPAKVAQLTKALNDGRLSTDQLKESFSLSDGALKTFQRQIDATKKSMEEKTTAAKKLSDETRQWLDSLTGQDKINAATQAINRMKAGQVDLTKITRQAADELRGTMTAAAEVYVARMKPIPPEIQRIIIATTDWKAINDQVSESSKAFGESLKRPLIPLRESVGETMIWKSRLEELNNTLIVTSKRRLPELKQSADEVVESLKTVGQRIKEGLKKDLEQIPGMVAGAFTGGGGIVGALKGIGSMLGSTVGEGIGNSIKALGKLGGPIGAAIGSLAGPLIGWVAGLFGKNKGRAVVEDWVKDTFGSFDAIQKKLANVQGGDDTLWKQLTQARTQEQAKAAIDAVTKALDDQKAKLGQVTDSVFGMVSAYVQGTGVTVPDSVRVMIATLVEAGKITKENAAELLGIGKAVPTFQQVSSAAEVLGVKIDEIGPKISNMAFIERVTPMIGAFETLEAAGADMGAVFAQSTSKVQPLVLEALKFGREMPDAMKPWLQRMVDAGLLVDENGVKLGDLSRIKFAEPLTAALDRLITKMQEMIDAIANKVVPAIGSIGRTRIDPIRIPYRFEQEGAGIPGGGGGAPPEDPVYAHTGGIVGRGRLLRFPKRGSDTVPAMLTPGEMVLSAAMQSNLSAQLRSPMEGAGHGDRPVHLHIHQDGRETATAILPHLSDVVNVNVG